MQENMTVAVADEISAPVETTPVETTAATQAPPVKSKRQRKAERKAAVASKPSKADKGKPKASKAGSVAPTVRDAFGNRVGTSSAAINATILASRVPLTVGEIHEQTGNAGRATKGATYQHCQWLLERGFIKLKDGGFIKNVKPRKGPKASKPADETNEATAD